MNVAVVKLMKLACGSVFPIEPLDSAVRPDVARLATCLAAHFKWTTPHCDALTIPLAYPAFLIPVFKGTAASGTLVDRVDSLINRDQGDALICIADL